MAKSYTTTSGTVRTPGAYPRYTVQTAPGGLATTGVIMLVGEATSGAHWSEETDLEEVAFGPDQLAEVVAKYGSGPLVDAFRGAVAASNDPAITGSFSRIVPVKTNQGTAASAAVLKLGPSTAYATIYAQSQGVLGNQIQIGVSSAVAEVVPTTSSFTYIPAVGTVNLNVRVNGGAASAVALVANRAPNLFVSDVAAASGVTVSGGVNRNILAVSGTLALAVVSGNTVTLTRSVAWAVTPTAGDTLTIPVGSVVAGGSQQNVGAYVITNATSTVITATKLSDAGKAAPAPVIGTITAPIAVGAAAIAAVTDAVAYSPVTISVAAGTVVPGSGKALEIAELTTGTDLLSRCAFGLGTTAAVSWVSKTAAPAILTSSAESEVTLTAARSADGRSETFTEGGEIAFTLGYTGATATATISATQLTTSAGLTITLSDFSTIKAMVDFINTQAGYSAAVGNATLGLSAPSTLDRVSAIGITSQFGTVMPGRVKIDAYRMFTAISEGSFLLQMGSPANRADAGLPAVTSTTFLSGGTRGATTNASVSAAMTALEAVEGNFVVPLFSRDATADIADGLTDASSTYTIAAVNAAVQAHVLAMSTPRRRKLRQALVSIQASFAAQQEAASNLSSFLVAVCFENVKDIDSNGDIVTFQPWMAAVKAASMQAAGFYKAITNKKVKISGLSHAAGDFNPKNDSHIENALIAGLMPIRASRTGGYVWVSDQTSYGTDDNFVFNSLQAVYAANTVAMTSGQKMEQAFVGQSTADISAKVALTYLDQLMAEFLRLKLIAPSDDAPKGYKNASIRISANVMLVSVEIKLATALDFIVIDFLVSPVQQSA